MSKNRLLFLKRHILGNLLVVLGSIILALGSATFLVELNIVTGGLSEINGMDHLVDIYFNGIGKVCKIDIMGIRNNKFSSALGSCIYFDDKLTLRGKSYNMINENEFKNLVSVNEGVSNGGIARKMFGHFFDN